MTVIINSAGRTWRTAVAMHWSRQLVYFSTSRDQVHRLAVNSTVSVPPRGRRRARTAAAAGVDATSSTAAAAAAEVLYQAGSRGAARAGSGLQLSVDWLYDRLYIADENTVRAQFHLEYLAVYGRASSAAFRQLSTHGQKFDPQSLYEPI